MSTQDDSHQMLDLSQAYFTGNVLNNSGETVNSATVIVSLYNRESGNMVATGYGLTVDPLAPNGTASYEVWINLPADFDLDSVEIEILAKGDLP